MASTWRLGTKIVQCKSVSLGTAQIDTATVEVYDSSLSVADGEYVSLTCDGNPIIWGRATVAATIDGASNRRTITIKGPWELLNSVVYQQGIKVQVPHAFDEEHPYGYALADVLSPDVTLGMDDDGDPLNTLQQAQDIAAYAIAAGVPIAFDPDFLGLPMRPTSRSGSSCAACLMACLRFHPDVLLQFVYTTSGATLRAVNAASLVATSYPRTGEYVMDADFKQRLNYKPDGIRILYQRVSPEGRIETHTEVAGSVGGQGKAPNVINWGIKLDGVTPPPILSQKIRTRPIPRSYDFDDGDEGDDGDDDDEDELKMNWWQNRLPWLRLAGVAELVSISKHKVTVDPPDFEASEDPDDGTDEPWSTDPEDYPRELVDGTIAAWMTYAVAAPLTITAQFDIETPLPDDMSEEIRDALREVFGTATKTSYTAQVTGTDASTRIYYALASYPDPPDWPEPQLANDYLNSFDGNTWAGQLALTGDSQPIVTMAGKVNVAGYYSEWAAMNAVIVAVQYSPDSHSVRVTCAPPDNFDIGDFYELQCANKHLQGEDARAAADRRTEAIPNAGGNIRGAGFTANRSVSKNTASASTGDLVPWQCEKEADFKLRVWPAAMFDGEGNSFWPTIDGVATVPETPHTYTIAEDAGEGNLYVECTVSDADDLHGIITAAALKFDDDDHNYNTNEAGKVKILICQVNSGEDTFTFLPVRSFVLCLRRFGPPGSETWDVTPM